MADVDCELVREFAKDKVWEKNHTAMADQFYISAYQHYSQHMVMGQVDVIITDSPLLLGLFYYKEENEVIRNAYSTFLTEEFKRQNNINFFIRRKKTYTLNGRTQTQEEALDIDLKIKSFLGNANISYTEVDGDDRAGSCLYSQIMLYMIRNNHC